MHIKDDCPYTICSELGPKFVINQQNSFTYNDKRNKQCAVPNDVPNLLRRVSIRAADLNDQVETLKEQVYVVIFCLVLIPVLALACCHSNLAISFRRLHEEFTNNIDGWEGRLRSLVAENRRMTSEIARLSEAQVRSSDTETPSTNSTATYNEEVPPPPPLPARRGILRGDSSPERVQLHPNLHRVHYAMERQ